MDVNTRVKLAIGELIVNLSVLQAENDALKAELEALKAAKDAA